MDLMVNRGQEMGRLQAFMSTLKTIVGEYEHRGKTDPGLAMERIIISLNVHRELELKHLKGIIDDRPRDELQSKRISKGATGEPKFPLRNTDESGGDLPPAS